MGTTDPATATTVAMRPPTTTATPPHTMDMDIADHTTDIGGLIIVDIARRTIVRTMVRVSTAGRTNLRPIAHPYGSGTSRSKITADIVRKANRYAMNFLYNQRRPS